MPLDLDKKMSGDIKLGGFMGLPSSDWDGGADDGGGEDEEEELTEDGVLFYVNQSGCPMDDRTWNRMWDHVAKIHPDGYSMIYKIRDKSDLPDVPIPRFHIQQTASIPEKIELAQKYMVDLQYNHTGTQFYEIRKNRPISGLIDTAKEMMQEALPIKCLEAIILGTHLTNGLSGVDRFPISFKSNFQGNNHRHVVLGVYYNGQYGAIGMSRRHELMYKPLIFKSLSKVVLDFVASYRKYMHVVKKVKIGLHIPHDAHSYEQIHWKAITISLSKGYVADDQCRDLDRHAREMRTQQYRPPGTEYPPRKPNLPHSHTNGASTGKKKSKAHKASSDKPAKDVSEKQAKEVIEKHHKEVTEKQTKEVTEETKEVTETGDEAKVKAPATSYQVRM